MIRRGLIALVGLVVVAATTIGVSRLKPAAPGVDRRTLWLDKVKRGPMLREVRGVGTLVSEDILWVPAVVSGRVTRILVEPGTAVEPNTVLLELNNPELELELFNAKSESEGGPGATGRARSTAPGTIAPERGDRGRSAGRLQ